MINFAADVMLHPTKNSMIMDETDLKTIIDFSKTGKEIIEGLKNKTVSVPAWADLEKEYDPEKHDVNDKSKRPDKIRDQRIEEVSRICLALQQLLVRRITEFTFAISVKRIYGNSGENETRQKIAKAIEAVYKHARIDTENLHRSYRYFASCEICTLWYAVEKQNSLYGFDSRWKLKCKTYSPMDGYELYPLFDEMDDMLAMSFEYEKTVGDKKLTFFETYTADRHLKWKQQEGEWELVLDEQIKLLKIPAIYTCREKPIWAGLSNIVNEIELTLSRNSDVIAYNSAPVLMIAGALQGAEQKGETRRIYRVENGGNIAYVSWQQSVEAIKYQIEMLLRLFFMQSQMPDISFENIKGINTLSEPAQRALLTDAHLKVGDEKGVLIEFFEREANIIKSFLGEMNVSWKNEIENVDIEHVITPYIQNDETLLIDKYLKANGGKPLISHQESIEQAGLSANPQQTFELIEKEENDTAQRNSLTDVFNTAE
jgi:hypothetical protein